MSGDNMKSGPVMGPFRSVVWQGVREGLIMDEEPDGRVCLIRSSEVDDGPSRSLVIDADAIGPLAGKLWALAVHRACRGLGQAMARAQETLRARQLGAGK